MEKSELTDKDFLSLTIPFILSTITQPLLGAVDTIVAGRLTSAFYIAGISVGSNIFNTMYWIFGFLRVSTTAFSAQALGKKSKADASIAFIRPILVALVISIIFVVFQNYILYAALWFVSPDEKVKLVTMEYFNWVIWGAPFVLSNYVILGWLMGQKKIKASLTMQIFGNLLNSILSYVLGLTFGLGIQGIALATLISQIVSTIIGSFFLWKCKSIEKINLSILFEKNAWHQMLKVNKNLMKRTACLLLHNNIFIMLGARFGTVLLAANGILFQINSVTSYMFDGIANGASVYSGKALGEENTGLLKQVKRMTLKWTLILTGFILIGYLLFQNVIFNLFTSLEEVIEGVKTYRLWLYIYPIVSGIGLSFYGIYTGVGSTENVFISTLKGLVGFLVVLVVSIPIFKNHGLWISVMVFYGVRSLVMMNKLYEVDV